MILWIIAILLLAGAAGAGLRQGVVRAGCTFVGLVLAALLAVPVGGIFKALLPIFGLHHPVVLAFVGPLLAFVLILVLAKVAGLAVHKKADAYYKYDAVETERLLWERMSQRVGLCVGVANGAMYFLLLTVLVTVIGYATVPVGTSPKNPLWLKTLNRLARDAHGTGMIKATAPFIPAGEVYFDAADVLGLVFNNSLLQNRLSRYPLLSPLAERKEFQELAGDVKFQQTWASQPSLPEMTANEKLKPALRSTDLFTNVLGAVRNDLPDLKQYLLTGKSAKYDDEKILGLWDFDYQATIQLARKRPNITTSDLTKLRRALGSTMVNAILIAGVDHRVTLKTPVASSQGKWESDGGGTRYRLDLVEGGKPTTALAVIEGARLLLTKGDLTLVFEK